MYSYSIHLGLSYNYARLQSQVHNYLFSDPTVLDECDITEDIKEKLIERIGIVWKRFKVKISADIEVFEAY